MHEESATEEMAGALLHALPTGHRSRVPAKRAIAPARPAIAPAARPPIRGPRQLPAPAGSLPPPPYFRPGVPAGG